MKFKENFYYQDNLHKIIFTNNGLYPITISSYASVVRTIYIKCIYYMMYACIIYICIYINTYNIIFYRKFVAAVAIVLVALVIAAELEKKNILEHFVMIVL